MNMNFKQLETDYAKAYQTLKDEIKNLKAQGASGNYGNDRALAAVRKCANLTKKLSETAPDEETSQAYKKDYDTYCRQAARMGSTMRNEVPKTSLDDIAGLEELKETVRGFLFLIKNPGIHDAYKIETGLGLLMYGPPGTGKTLMAEAIAHELNVPFFTITPADIFKPHVGESEDAVRQKFNELEACEDGAVLFIDECEGIFGQRRADAQRHETAVTNEILQRMNGFGGGGRNRALIAATNCPELLDPAYLRYKRFSTVAYVDLPDEPARRFLIDKRLKGIPVENKEEIIDRLTEWTKDYYSGADICGIAEAGIHLVIQEMRNSGITTPQPLTLAHIKKAFDGYSRSITPEMLLKYKRFEAGKKTV